MNYRLTNLLKNTSEIFPGLGGNFVSLDLENNILFNGKKIGLGRILQDNGIVRNINLSISLDAIVLPNCEIKSFGTSKRLNYFSEKGVFALELYNNYETHKKAQKILEKNTFEELYDFQKTFGNLQLIKNDLIFGNLQPFELSFPKKINHTILSCFSFNKIDYLWHFNLDSLNESHVSQLGIYNLEELSYITEPLLQINNLIGVLNNQLWVDVDVQMRGSFLLALDTETGAVVHLLQTTELQTAMPEHLYYYKKLRRTAKSHLDIENNMILGFGADFDHWQVDLTQPEPIIKFWYLEENFKNIPKAHAVQIDFSGITPTHIFFPNSHGHFPQVIAFNRKTMQVDWRKVFNDEKGYFSPKQVKANDTHLFVHMSDNSLHIFEKTEDWTIKI